MYKNQIHRSEICIREGRGRAEIQRETKRTGEKEKRREKEKISRRRNKCRRRRRKIKRDGVCMHLGFEKKRKWGGCIQSPSHSTRDPIQNIST